IALDNVGARFDYVVKRLADQPYVMGNAFTIVDAYLFTIVHWHNFLKFDLARWPALSQYQARVAARPGVQAALRAEHLLKPQAKAA
ncbi:MAG TPA: glutathione binding-like protein, partial [Casimicrobiaceae bacterium]|nr:glutathione binding-like protein [Casimicrobiaceae bacterium]